MYAFALYSVTYFAYVQCINSLLCWLTITGTGSIFESLWLLKQNSGFRAFFWHNFSIIFPRQTKRLYSGVTLAKVGGLPFAHCESNAHPLVTVGPAFTSASLL